MLSEVTDNWWCCTVDPARPFGKILPAMGAYEEVNPESGGGLDYASYLKLDRLLSAQTPASTAPDERIFIITHQLSELVFKQMIFDLVLITTTLESVLAFADDAFHAAVSGRGDDLWKPAARAATRLAYSSGSVLPAIIRYLDAFDGAPDTFSNSEFAEFRKYLAPASGFQTAQFRLIQRAFGKAPLMGIRLFPTREIAPKYKVDDPPVVVSVTDTMILRDQSRIAAPEAGSTLHVPERIEDAVNHVLERISRMAEGTGAPAVVKIGGDDVDHAIERFAAQWPSDATSRFEAIHIFSNDLRQAVAAENARRETLADARAGSEYLHDQGPGSDLAGILDHLVATDVHLHGPQEQGFLTTHYRLARNHITALEKQAARSGTDPPSAGTAGGGPPYLQRMRRNLVPLFPAFVAWSEDHLAPKQPGA